MDLTLSIRLTMKMIGVSYITVTDIGSTSNSTVRHNADREMSLPTCLGLMLHASTRKRDLVDKMHSLGISISYDRVLKKLQIVFVNFTKKVWFAPQT